MGLSSCSDHSTGPSENFWLSNAWDILTVSRPRAETCFISGGEAAVEVLGAGGALQAALPLQALSPPPPLGDNRVLCSLPCLSGTSDWGLPRTGFQGGRTQGSCYCLGSWFSEA